MPRPSNADRARFASPELLQAERAGQELLYRYCRERAGRQRQLVDDTGIQAPSLSRMASAKTPISFEAAVLLDVATKGELRAELLCPSRADLLTRFVAGRQVPVAA